MTRAYAMIAVLALIFSGTPATASNEESVTIIHQNDLHGWLFPSGNRNGMAEMARLLEELFREEPSSFYAMAGDLFTGPDLAPDRKGRMETEVWNAFWRHMADRGYGDRVLISLGNHEFDYGLPEPSEFASPLLCANLVSDDGKPFYTPFKTIVTGEGLRVGFIGLLLEKNPRVLKATGKKALSFIPMQTAVERSLKEMGPLDLTVLMIHDHVDAIRQLALELPPEAGVDLIIAGHDHLLLEQPLRVAGIPLCEAGAMNRFYGRLDLTVAGGLISRLRSGIVPWVPAYLDHKMMAVKEEADARKGPMVARLKGSLTGSYLRNTESSLGDFVTDAFRWATGTDIAMTNGSSLRMDFPVVYDEPLVLREGDMRDITPFRNSLVTGQITGKQVLQMLEGETEALQNQVSGLRYVADLSRPAGTRVMEAFVDGKPLVPERTYSITHNAYCASSDNMQRYLHLPPGSVNWKETRWKDYEALIGYARHLGTIEYPAGGMRRIIFKD